MNGKKKPGTTLALILAVTLIISAGMGMVSCAVDGSDETEPTTAETQFVEDQVAASMSSEDGGTVYAAETLSDPELYESLDAEEGTVDPVTGYRSVSWTLDLPYAAAGGAASFSYRLFDETGTPQTAFDVTTRSASVILEYGRQIGAVRFTAIETSRMEVSVEGLNTDTVTISGLYSFQRGVDGNSDSVTGFHTDLESSGNLEELTLLSNGSSWAVTGGSASFAVSGSVNGHSYSRSGEWVFGSGGTATLTMGGASVTVNIVTGETEAEE